MLFRKRAGAALCALATLAAGCGGSGQPEGETPAATTAAPEPPPPLPGESTISGRVSYSGTAPTPRIVRMEADPLCMPEGGAVRSEVIVVGPDNQLQNVFLYVKDGLGDRTFPAPQTPVVLDQVGCRYTPHVFGVQAGQPIEIVNSDATVHNVHAVPKVNTEFNFIQQTKGKRDIRTFTQQEIMVPFRCDVHGWMNSYAGVVPHPFYAVSGPDGSFEIRGLPEGTYTIEAWHEQLGTQTQTVTVDGTSGASMDFTFAGKG
jgi:plastocyanin